MIDKRTPRKLNKSLDSKLRGKLDMYDALNVSVTEDGRDGDGNGGVIKPIKSNFAMNMEGEDGSVKYVLGKCIDSKYDVIYFFVHVPDNTSLDGVYAYDPNGYLPDDHDVDDVVAVYLSSSFNFDPELFVKADITYTQQRFINGDDEYEDTPMLFFTDNKNEPKKLNILRAITEEGPAATDGESDFILACTKTPVDPPTAVWTNDTSVTGNEFLNVEGFQFAYQCVYKDSNESAISTYSDVYIPPGYLNYSPSGSSSLFNSNNALEITVPTGDMSSEVESVKILGRRGESGSWFLLSEVDKGVTYLFNNTEVNAAIPRDVQTKDYDALPYRAQAQTIIDNRLMYGNYVENRDQASISATITPKPQERATDFAVYNVSAIPATVPSPYTTDDGAQNKNMGFVIDTSTITEETVDAGSLINFSFTVTPNQNFHVYNAHNSYHQSPQMGDDFSNEGYLRNVRALNFSNGENEGDPGSPDNSVGESEVSNGPKGFWWQNTEHSGAQFIKYMTENFKRIPLACSDGVNKVWYLNGGQFRSSRWKWRATDPATNQSNNAQAQNADFGTCAGNPLIVQGKSFTISCSFIANGTLSRENISRALALIISGETLPAEGDPVNELSAFASSVTPPTQESLSYTVDVGLTDNSTFPDTGAIGKLVTTAVRQFSKDDVLDDYRFVSGGGTSSEGDSEDGGGGAARIPLNPSSNPDGAQDVIKGFFVLNKAEVQFGTYLDTQYSLPRNLSSQLDGVTNYSGNPNAFSERKDQTKNRIGLYIRAIDLPDDKHAVMTCMRRPWPGSNWYAYAPWNVPNGFRETPTGFVNKSLFPSGITNTPGVQEESSFSGALTNNIGLYEQGLAEDAENQYHQFNVPMDYLRKGYGDRLSAMKERDIFINHDRGEESEDNRAPWANVFGGLLPDAGWIASFTDDNRTIRFFDGEKPDGTPLYSLMDGQGGPGGSSPHPKSHYGNYTLYTQNGLGIEGRVNGIQNLGSAPLFSLSDVFQDPGGPTQFYETVHPGVYGPALGNNLMVGYNIRHSSVTQFFGNSENNWKNPKYLDQDTGEYTPAGVASSDSGLSGQPPYHPVSFTSSLPLLHGSEPFPPANGNGGAFLPVDYDEGSVGGAHGGTHHDGENDGQVYELKLSNADARNIQMYVLPPAVGLGRTFKAGANHSFGVIFYDDRGRPSNVHPIGSANAPWYSERPGFEGAVYMSITLSGAVPPEAKKFQIVYSGQTSYSRYLQYATAGAFISKGDSGNGNIYVSLNYLQDHPASLAKSFGARSVDGSQDIYTFRQGDRLRVVSHYNTESARVFNPQDYEFNIVDQVTLSEGTDNPLYDVEQDGEAPHPAKTGAFLILENNINALGFSFEDVEAGGNDINAQTHNWNKRCVVEINSPKLSSDEDSLVYYETGNVFDIADFNSEKTIQNGDSWWRSVPMNFSKIDSGFFETLITSQTSNSNLFPYYTESDRFSYKVLNSDVNGKGKFKVYLPDQQKSVRSSSITYSDKNNPASRVFTLTSFNPTKGQFKDLPIEHGDINYIANTDDSIFVIQSSRCSSIPVNRNIITDLGDTQSLVAAKAVLGTEGFYAGEFGCDDNPESVCEVSNTIYFASKSNREVYKFNRSSGIQVVSDINMKSYFRKLFKAAEQDEIDGLGPVKVVGGYDPEKDSFILSVYNLYDTDSNPVAEPDPDQGGNGGPVEVVDVVAVQLSDGEISQRLSTAQRADFDNNGLVSTADLLDFLSVLSSETSFNNEQTFTGDEANFLTSDDI